MAKAIIKNITGWQQGGRHYATSWCASLSDNIDDKDSIIEFADASTEFLFEWEPMLPVIGGAPGEYYHDLDRFYIFFKLHFDQVLMGSALPDGETSGYMRPVYGKRDTEWFRMPAVSQRSYDAVITRFNQPILVTSTEELNKKEEDKAWALKNLTKIHQ